MERIISEKVYMVPVTGLMAFALVEWVRKPIVPY